MDDGADGSTLAYAGQLGKRTTRWKLTAVTYYATVQGSPGGAGPYVFSIRKVK